MKNELTVKTVPFMGSELMAAKDEKTGKIYAGVSYICKGIGFDKNLKDAEVKRVQRDIVLKRGCVKFDAGVFDQNNEAIAIDHELIPIWLAKIPITPAMQRERPEVADRLVQYQLKAAKVLANAFLHKETPKARKAALPSVNHATEIICRRYDKAGVAPGYTALAVAQIYRSQGINLPDPPLEADGPTYDNTAIANALGVMSKASGGKEPHAHAVGAIVAALNLPQDMIIRVPFSQNGHSADYNRYKAPVLERVQGWLKSHGYPEVIRGRKNYQVVYSQREVPAC